MSKNILGGINNTLSNIESRINNIESQPKIEVITNTTSTQNINSITLSNNNNNWVVGVSGSLNGFYIDKKKSNNNKFFIDNLGNVGIGTNKPNYNLDIIGDTNISHNLYVNNDVNINSTLLVKGNQTIN